MKVPTTAEPRSVRKTGMRIAQTRGGKRSCRGWPGSTNGYMRVSIDHLSGIIEEGGYHEQSPCRVVEKDGGSGQEHGGSHDWAQLQHRLARLNFQKKRSVAGKQRLTILTEKIERMKKTREAQQSRQTSRCSSGAVVHLGL